MPKIGDDKQATAEISSIFSRSARTDKIRNATLMIAAEAGHKLNRRQGRALVYGLPDGRTVRLRTTTHRCLQVTATSPDMDRAALDIEGVDFLLFGATESGGDTDTVEAYLIPSDIAAADVRAAHKAWLAAGATTKGENLKPAIWLDRAIPTSDKFSMKWAKYRIGTTTI